MKKKEEKEDYRQFGCSIRKVFSLPGQKSGRENKNGREKIFPYPSLSQRNAGGKGWLNDNARKPALGKEEPRPFLDSRMSFCPGIENTLFPQKNLVFLPGEKPGFISFALI
jgi:hypothetical protein